MGCTCSFNVTNATTTNAMYVDHPESVIIACYFNPKNNEYRKLAFLKFYQSIQHVNHRIIECGIAGSDFLFPPNSPYIKQVRTESLLWHKETLLNNLIQELPTKFKFVFWIDGDLTFTNKNWIVDSVSKLQNELTVIQPFKHAYHLEQGETVPNATTRAQTPICGDIIEPRNSRRVWKSYGCVVEETRKRQGDFDDSKFNDYDLHGHVGFAWGIRREILVACGGLYDRALVGGGDHVMAHAIMTPPTGCHMCISKSHVDSAEIAIIQNWSRTFHTKCERKLGYCEGDVYHDWHGDLTDRRYYERIKDFSPFVKFIDTKDQHGLYLVTATNTKRNEIMKYMDNYFEQVSATGKAATVLPSIITKVSTTNKGGSTTTKPTTKGGYYYDNILDSIPAVTTSNPMTSGGYYYEPSYPISDQTVVAAGLSGADAPSGSIPDSTGFYYDTVTDTVNAAQPDTTTNVLDGEFYYV